MKNIYKTTLALIVAGVTLNGVSLYAQDSASTEMLNYCKPLVAHLKNRYSSDDLNLKPVTLCQIKSVDKKPLFVDTTNAKSTSQTLVNPIVGQFQFDDGSRQQTNSKNLCVLSGAFERNGSKISFVALSNQAVGIENQSPKNQAAGFIEVIENSSASREIIKFNLNSDQSIEIGTSLTSGGRSESSKTETTVKYDSKIKILSYNKTIKEGLLIRPLPRLFGNHPKQEFVFNCK
jgi:hypothetical protein